MIPDPTAYPTKRELGHIRNWSREKSFTELLDYVKAIWHWPDWGWHQRGRQYRVSTGGWSGNEDLINALCQNKAFWLLCWWSSRRGGHHVFKVPHTRSTIKRSKNAAKVKGKTV